MPDSRMGSPDVAILVLSLLLISGISGCTSPSPEQVAADFYAAEAAGRKHMAAGCCTQPFAEDVFYGRWIMNNYDAKEVYHLPDRHHGMETFTATITGNKAVVISSDDPGTKIHLVKWFGKWKINAIDQALPLGGVK